MMVWLWSWHRSCMHTIAFGIIMVMIMIPTGFGKDNVLMVGIQLPLSGSMSDMGHRSLAAIQLAVNQLNNQSIILSNHSLSLSIIDTQSLPSVAMTQSILQLSASSSSSSLIGVIGDIRSIVSIPLASLAAAYNLCMISPGSGDDMLSDKSLFPSFGRTIPRNNDHARAVINVLQYYHWRCAIILSSNDSWAYELATTIMHGITTTTSDSSSSSSSIWSNSTLIVERLISFSPLSLSSINNAITAMLSLSCRIVVVTAPWSSYEALLAAMPSSAVNFTFIAATAPPLSPQWSSSSFSSSIPSFNNIAVVPSLSPASEPIVMNIMNHCDSLHASYCDHMDITQLYAYDALLTYAYTAHNIVNDHNGTNDINGNGISSSQVWSRLSSTTFTGASGMIEYNSNGDRVPTFDIIQVYDQSISLIGTCSYTSIDMNAPLVMSHTAIWYGNYTSGVPSDGMSVTIGIPSLPPPSIARISSSVQITTWVMMSLLLLTSIALHMLLVKYRDHTVIRASAIQYQHLMIVGASIGYIAAGITVMEKTSQASCTTPILLIGISFALLVGAIVDKTSRMKLIFAAKRLRMKEYSGPALLARIALLLACEVIIQLIWNLVDAPTPTLAIDQWTNRYIYQCESKYPQIWWALLLTPKVMTLIYAVWLAYAIRDIHSHWNESKYIAQAMYHLIIVAAVVLVIIALGGHVLDASQALIVFGIFLSIFGVMIIFFGSKFYNMFISLEFLTTLPQSNVQLGHRRSSRSIDFGGTAIAAFMNSPFVTPTTLNTTPMTPTNGNGNGAMATPITTTTNGGNGNGNGSENSDVTCALPAASILAASLDAQRTAQQQMAWNLLGNTGVPLPPNGLAGVSFSRLAQLGSPPPHLRRASHSYNRLPAINSAGGNGNGNHGSTTSNPNGDGMNDTGTGTGASAGMGTPMSRRNTLRDNQIAQMRGVIRAHSGSRLPMSSPRAVHSTHLTNMNNSPTHTSVTNANNSHTVNGNTNNSNTGNGHGSGPSSANQSPVMSGEQRLVITEPPLVSSNSNHGNGNDSANQSSSSDHHLTASATHHQHNNSVSTTLLLSPVASSSLDGSGHAFSSSFELSPGGASTSSAAAPLSLSFDPTIATVGGNTMRMTGTMSVNGNGNGVASSGINGNASLVPLTLSTSMSDTTVPLPPSSSSSSSSSTTTTMVSLLLPGAMQSTSPPHKKRSSLASPSSRRSSMGRPPPSPIPENVDGTSPIPTPVTRFNWSPASLPSPSPSSSSSLSSSIGATIQSQSVANNMSMNSGGAAATTHGDITSSPPQAAVGIRSIRLASSLVSTVTPSSSSPSSSSIVLISSNVGSSSAAAAAILATDDRTMTPVMTNDRVLTTPSPPLPLLLSSSLTQPHSITNNGHSTNSNHNNGMMNGSNGVSRHSISPVFASSGSGRTLLGPLIVHTPSPNNTPPMVPFNNNNSDPLVMPMIDTLLSTHNMNTITKSPLPSSSPPPPPAISPASSPNHTSNINGNHRGTNGNGTLSSSRNRAHSDSNNPPTPPTRSPSLVARPSPRGSIAT